MDTQIDESDGYEEDEEDKLIEFVACPIGWYVVIANLSGQESIYPIAGWVRTSAKIVPAFVRNGHIMTQSDLDRMTFIEKRETGMVNEIFNDAAGRPVIKKNGRVGGVETPSPRYGVSF